MPGSRSTPARNRRSRAPIRADLEAGNPRRRRRAGQGLLRADRHPGAKRQHPADAVMTTAAIDAKLREATDARTVPGVVAIATTADSPLYEGAFGVRRLGDGAGVQRG